MRKLASSKRTFLMAALGALLLLVTVQPSNAGPGSPGPWSVVFYQFGVPVTQVQAGTEFEIRAEGFHNDVHPVKVCLFDHQCQLVEPDRSGCFSVMRTIADVGQYEIRVYQMRDANLSPEWRMKTMGNLAVN